MKPGTEKLKMQNSAITEDNFVRDLPYNVRAKLAETLDVDHLWERLASIIPAKPDNIFITSVENRELRYTMANVANLSGTRALIKDWGMQNCRIKHLVEALYQAELNKAAAYIQQHVLRTDPIRSTSHIYNSSDPPKNKQHVENSDNKEICNHGEREPDGRVNCSTQPLPCISETCGNNPNGETPSVRTMDNPIMCRSGGQKPNDLATPAPPADSPVIESKNAFDSNTLTFEDIDQLKDISFSIVQAITSNFDKKNYKDGGNLIGEGGFGTVFIGTFSTGYKVAVKCLKDSTDDSLEQFKTEVETLAMFKHENLVQLLGYSIAENGPRCLVYQYMSNGSLEERLACRFDTEPLSNKIRLEIIKGTARGIAFLHKGGLVHRDIKSANILLDDEFNPKVGDFATARVLPVGMTSHIMKTSVIIGTMAYLAPEAFSFVIHPSLDSFSYGVVILEILTGLPVTDPNREDIDLKIHVQEHCCEGDDGQESGTIYDLLDTQGGVWTESVVEMLYSISCCCLEHARRKRPTMVNILSQIEQLDQ